MPVIERYILRRTAQVFLLTLCALTAALWVTQVLQQLDVVTANGQAIWVFLLMTMLALPTLIQLIAPIALLVGIVVTLNSLTGDGELPVISAAGGSQRTVNRPIIILSIVVMAYAAVSHHVISPYSLSAFRTILTHVRADVIATLVHDGRFRELEQGLTMHFRKRTPNGGFLDVFIDDQRDPRESRTFTAARGLLLDQAGGAFLVLQDGDLIRAERGGEGGVVTFETYALDLSRFNPANLATVYEAMERSTLFLLDPPDGDVYLETFPQRVRAEIHDRTTAPIYALVFTLIALGFLARPRSNRQDRTFAIVTVLLLCLLFRAAGLTAMTLARKFEAVTVFLYVVPLAGLALGLYANLRDTRTWFTPRMERGGEAITRTVRRTLGVDHASGGMAEGQ